MILGRVKLPRRPGKGWKNVGNGSVWEHTTGLSIHLLGVVMTPNGEHISWDWSDEINAKEQQGWNKKRALMVWALSLLEEPELNKDKTK